MNKLNERQKEILLELEAIQSSTNSGFSLTGSKCKKSGLYRAGKDQYIPLSKGEKFPPCKGCESQFWFLVIAV